MSSRPVLSASLVMSCLPVTKDVFARLNSSLENVRHRLDK